MAPRRPGGARRGDGRWNPAAPPRWGPARGQGARPPAEQATFDQQWATAVAAVAALDTPAELAEAGYVQAAVQGAGVGVHYVDWTRIDQPFDPARPAMVLVDERGGRH